MQVSKGSARETITLDSQCIIVRVEIRLGQVSCLSIKNPTSDSWLDPLGGRAFKGVGTFIVLVKE